MKRTMPISLLIAALALAMLSDRSGALEIFRIGGENLPPPPEASDPAVTFTPVPWSDFIEKDGFDDEAFAEDILRPLFLTPEDNIASD